MSGKNLTFKLIMEGDNKGLVASAKQSQEVVSKVFDTIKQEAEQLQASTDKASEGLKGLVTPETTKLAKALTDNLGNATSIINDAGTQAQATAKNFTEFGKKSEQALGLLISGLSEAKKKLEAFSKTNASPAQIQAAQAQVDNLEKQVTEAGTAFYDFNQTVSEANTKLKETDSAAQTAQKGLNSAKFAVTALVGAMATLGIGLGIRELAQTADTYTNLSARINIATKEGGDFTSAMAGVHQVALMTNSSLDATGSLFTRLNTVSKEMGMTQQQALDLTKTVTQAIQIGGGSAQASEAAITQFIQAMQGGALRGEEFNSIMENGYGVADALAKGLGVTTGELRKMAENGELSAERVVKALQSQASEVQKTYDQFPTTIGNALQKIATSWQIVIGEMDQANGSSAAAAEALIVVADNLGIIKVFLDDVGLGFASLVGDLQGGIDASTIDAFKNAISAAYDAVKDLVSTVYEFGVDILDILDTSITSTLSIFSSFTGGVSSAGEQVSFLERIFQGLGITFGFISDGLTAIGLILKVSTGNFYALASAANSVMAALTWGDVSKQFAVNADLMKDKAKQYYAEADQKAQEFQSKGLQRLKEAAQTEAEKDAESVASSKAKLDALLAHQQTEANSKKVTEDEKLKAVQAYAEASITANKGVMDGVMQADLMTKGYIVTIDEAGKVSVQAGVSAAQAAENAKVKEEALKVAKENVKKADEEYLAYQKQAAIERAALEQQIEQAKRTGDLNSLNSAQTSLAGIDTKEAELANNRNLRIAELDRLNSGSGDVLEGSAARARKAAVALGLDLDVSLNKVSSKFKESGISVDTFVLGLKKLGIEGQQAGEVTYQAWQKWLDGAKSQAEIDAAKAKLQSFGEQGKLSTSQVEMGLQAIKRASQELPAALSPAEAAMERLGIKSKEQLKLAAENALTDLNTVMKSGEATQEGLQRAYEETIRLAYASGDAQVIAAANAKAAYLGLEVQLDSTGKATVAKLGEIQQAAVATQRTVQQVSNSPSKSTPEATKTDGEDDYWENFKKRRAEITAKQNAANQSKAINSTFKSSDVVGQAMNQTAIPNAPMIASGFNAQPIETSPTSSMEIKIDLGTGQSASVQAAPDQADALKTMMQELERIKRSS